jgi:hypothetical protein
LTTGREPNWVPAQYQRTADARPASSGPASSRPSEFEICGECRRANVARRDSPGSTAGGASLWAKGRSSLLTVGLKQWLVGPPVVAWLGFLVLPPASRRLHCRACRGVEGLAGATRRPRAGDRPLLESEGRGPRSVRSVLSDCRVGCGRRDSSSDPFATLLGRRRVLPGAQRQIVRRLWRRSADSPWAVTTRVLPGQRLNRQARATVRSTPHK